jgi:hypothetical protein
MRADGLGYLSGMILAQILRSYGMTECCLLRVIIYRYKSLNYKNMTCHVQILINHATVLCRRVLAKAVGVLCRVRC